MHVMEGDVERIYLPYQGGIIGLKNLEKEYKTTMVGITNHMTHKDDIQIKDLFKHQRMKAQDWRKQKNG